MNNNDNMVGGAFLAFVLFGFFVWMVSKLVTTLFHQLGLLFHEVGIAALSFLGMAWALAQIAGILSVAILLVYAAYKYVLLVKRGTEILATVESQCNELAARVSANQGEMEKRVHATVNLLRRELNEALAEPEVGPQEEVPPSTDGPALEIETVARTVNESATTPRVSNPY